MKHRIMHAAVFTLSPQCDEYTMDSGDVSDCPSGIGQSGSPIFSVPGGSPRERADPPKHGGGESRDCIFGPRFSYTLNREGEPAMPRDSVRSVEEMLSIVCVGLKEGSDIAEKEHL